MVSLYGDYDLTETVNIPFNTFSSDDPAASVTVTDLVAGDIYVHKDGVEGTPTGITVSLNVGTVNGNHLAILDLTDTNDAGFYAVGSRYQVRMEGVTIDGATVNAWIGAFSIGCTLRPTTAGRTLDIQATGEVDANLTMIGGVAQSATDLKDFADTGYDPSTHRARANLEEILGHLLTQTGTQVADGFEHFFNEGTPTGTINSLPNAVAGAAGGLFIAGTNAATSVTTAFTANITGDITGNLSGSVGSVTTKTDYSLKDRSIKSETFAAGAIDAPAIADEAIDLATFAAAMKGGEYLKVDLNGVRGTALNGNGAQMAAALDKLLDVVTPLLVASDVMRGTDSAATAGDAMTLSDEAIKNATFAADVGSTAYATNIIALAVRKVLDEADVCNMIADYVRRRTQANVEASENGDALDLSSAYGFIQQAQESSMSGATLTVKKTDGSTTLGTKTLATTADVDPVTGIS